MAAKVALTAEEFRENSQRSIALFNTEKLSTDSTHVLKSAYCNSVHFCSCNLHGACGGKALCVAAQSPRQAVAICTGRVEAKGTRREPDSRPRWLQSARGVWRQRSDKHLLMYRKRLQSARGVWRQSIKQETVIGPTPGCNLHGACGGKDRRRRHAGHRRRALQSARGVWRQRVSAACSSRSLLVAICTGRVEAKDFTHKDRLVLDVAICTGRVEAKVFCLSNHLRHKGCNLHGACGGKAKSWT